MNAPIFAHQWRNAKFTVAQIWSLIERGLISPDAKFEMIDGEIIQVSPKGPLHEDIRRIVNRWLTTLPPKFDWLAETSLYLDDVTFLEPDYVVIDRALASKDLRPDQVLLAIEVGHDSWRRDIGEKAQLYAQHGVQEYWAIHAETRMTRVHREPGREGWGAVRDTPAGEEISPLFAPDLTFSVQ